MLQKKLKKKRLSYFAKPMLLGLHNRFLCGFFPMLL